MFKKQSRSGLNGDQMLRQLDLPEMVDPNARIQFSHLHREPVSRRTTLTRWSDGDHAPKRV